MSAVHCSRVSSSLIPESSKNYFENLYEFSVITILQMYNYYYVRLICLNNYLDLTPDKNLTKKNYYR